MKETYRIGPKFFLRTIYFLQRWFNIWEPLAEDCIYDNAAMGKLFRIDLSAFAAPDETSICKLRHFTEEDDIGKKTWLL